MKPGGSRLIGARRTVTFNLEEEERDPSATVYLGGELKQIASGSKLAIRLVEPTQLATKCRGWVSSQPASRLRVVPV